MKNWIRGAHYFKQWQCCGISMGGGGRVCICPRSPVAGPPAAVASVSANDPKENLVNCCCCDGFHILRQRWWTAAGAFGEMLADAVLFFLFQGVLAASSGERIFLHKTHLHHFVKKGSKSLMRCQLSFDTKNVFQSISMFSKSINSKCPSFYCERVFFSTFCFRCHLWLFNDRGVLPPLGDL